MSTTVLAQTTPAPSSGFDPMTLILLAAFAFLIFMMFRGRKKARTAQEQLKSELAPGAEVMTQFGLFGTVLSIDNENNKVVLELSPGNTATVHAQAVAKVVPQDAPAAAVAEEAPRRGRVTSRRPRRKPAAAWTAPTPPRSRPRRAASPRGAARDPCHRPDARHRTPRVESPTMSTTGPIRHARRALLWLGVIFILCGAILATGVATGKTTWSPKLALDLEGGTQMILAPKVQGGDTAHAGAAGPSRGDHPPARRRLRRVRGGDQHPVRATRSWCRCPASPTPRRVTHPGLRQHGVPPGHRLRRVGSHPGGGPHPQEGPAVPDRRAGERLGPQLDHADA